MFDLRNDTAVTLFEEHDSTIPQKALGPIERNEIKKRELEKKRRWAAAEEIREGWTAEMFAEEEDRLREEIENWETKNDH